MTDEPSRGVSNAECAGGLVRAGAGLGISVSCAHPGAQAMANASKPSNAGFRCESIILLLSGDGRGVGILRQCYDVR
jgi:hypothetical protein